MSWFWSNEKQTSVAAACDAEKERLTRSSWLSGWWGSSNSFTPARNAPNGGVNIREALSQRPTQVISVSQQEILDTKARMRKVETNAVRPAFYEPPIVSGIREFFEKNKLRKTCSLTVGPVTVSVSVESHPSPVPENDESETPKSLVSEVASIANEIASISDKLDSLRQEFTTAVVSQVEPPECAVPISPVEEF